MTLSNTPREPRREITESVVGIAVVGIAAGADYAFARWLEQYCGYDPRGVVEWPWFIGMIVGLLIGLGFVIFLLVTHAIGDAICTALESRGVQMRPRRRY